MHFLCILDRSSGFISAYELTWTKTKHIVQALQDFVLVFYGPPLLLTSDGGPQFQAANKAIQERAHGMLIHHKLSAAFYDIHYNLTWLTLYNQVKVNT